MEDPNKPKVPRRKLVAGGRKWTNMKNLDDTVPAVVRNVCLRSPADLSCTNEIPRDESNDSNFRKLSMVETPHATGQRDYGLPIYGFGECSNKCYDQPTGHSRQCECPTCYEALTRAQQEPCAQHAEGNRWMALEKKWKDPWLQNIYDHVKNGDGAKKSLQWCCDDESLTAAVRRFREYTSKGRLGHAPVHYGDANDLDLYPGMEAHGVCTNSKLRLLDVVLPKAQTWSIPLTRDHKERWLYRYERENPIGHSEYRRKHLPARIDPDNTSFGKASWKDEAVVDIMYSPKSRFEVEAESNFREHYRQHRKSHNQYHPGEHVCRHYDGNFSPLHTFGKPTPHDWNAGRRMKQIANAWNHSTPKKPYTTKLYATHMEYRKDKLAQPKHTNCIFHEHGENWVYGNKSAPELDPPVKEIMNNKLPYTVGVKAVQSMQVIKNWFSGMRHSFKSENGADNELFYDELAKADKDGTGTVAWTDFTKALIMYSVPRPVLSQEFKDALILIGVLSPMPSDRIKYKYFIELISGLEIPAFPFKTDVLKPYFNCHTNGCPHFRTTYAERTEGNYCSTCKPQRAAGVPSIREDQLPAVVRSTRDQKDYGDEGDAHSLIWTDEYTKKGLDIRDIFREYSIDEMNKIVCLASGVSCEEFKEAWEVAKKLDPEGKDRVSYQAFREGLSKVRERPECNRAIPIAPHSPETLTKIPVRGRRKPNPCAGVDPNDYLPRPLNFPKL